MITPELTRRSQELAAAREPFVTATVVRVKHPASVEPGSVALVLADGTIEGFVGGVCAEHSVRAYSLRALETGEQVLLRILPDPVEGEVAPEGVEVAAGEGAVTVKNPCLSGGAIEVFLEPAPPVPRVLVMGETPTADALARIGPELGLDVVAFEPGGEGPVAGDLGLVVAAHGRDELLALRSGLEAGVPYVGLVASGKRGAAVLDELRADGVDKALLERIDVPAGVPIGSHSGAEIAVSILAKLVSVRRQGSAASAASTGATSAAGAASAALAVDPICGMTVAAVPATLSIERDGETVYFCGEGCKAKFEAREEHASVG